MNTVVEAGYLHKLFTFHL